jgi:regulator of sigma E protease
MLATVLWFLLALGILVTFHEFGHFYVARRCGVKVLRFSVGFGKSLYSWRDRHGTEFVLAAIPLGGYVKMLDEREGEVPVDQLPMAFTQKSVWQRIAIVVAGPIANFILAILFYCVLALIGIKGVAPVIGSVNENSLAANAQLTANDEIISVGGKNTPTWTSVMEQLANSIGNTGSLDIEVKPFSSLSDGVGAATTKTVQLERWLYDSDRPDLLAELGVQPYQPETDWMISRIIDGGAAQQAGLQEGDKLISADGQYFDTWVSWVDYVRSHPGQAIQLEVLRNGSRLLVEITPDEVRENNQLVGKVGLGTTMAWPEGMVRESNYSLVESVGYGFSKTWEQAVVILSFLKKLITLDVSVKSMGGTFTIAQVAGDTASAGLDYYLAFLAFFSVSLGVFNLLPIPVLDGGHLLFYIIEAIKGRPLPEKVQLIGYQLGLFVVVSIMVVAHYNDLVRLFS